MKLLMRDEAKGREHTIFVTIFSALMVMLAIVVMLMASATAVSGVTLQLDKNAVDILDKQVENRAGYIQDQLQQAQELTDLSTYINETTQQMLDDETLSLKTLDSSSSDSLPLLLAAAPRMLETLRSKRISGIFLILNTHDFTDRTSGDRLPCVYLRDLDPDAVPSVVNSDILLECAPSELVQTFDITTDKAWSPALQYLDGEQDVFYVRPFQNAYEDDERMGAANYGRWTTLPYKLLGDDHEAIAYAQPLILDDGTVYGVLGVELKLHGHQTPVGRAAERPSRQLSAGLHHLRPAGRGAGSSCHLQHRRAERTAAECEMGTDAPAQQQLLVLHDGR